MKFNPHQKDNAIVRVLFACEFAHPIDAEKLIALDKIYEQFKIELPQKTVQQGLSFRIAPGQQPQPVSGVNGMSFTVYAPDGQMDKQFNANRTLIAFADMKYTRWDQVWPSAKIKLESALSVLDDVPIQAFGLEYQDRFYAEPTSVDEKIDVKSVLNEKSVYVAKKIFDLSDVWHSHHGSVQEEQIPNKHTCNDNINLALARRQDIPSPYLAIEITLQHRRVLDTATPAKLASNSMVEYFKGMHEHDRNVLLDLLTPEMAERIKLKRKQV